MNVNHPARIRLLIVDDSTFVRRALIRALAAQADIEIVGEARDGETALRLIDELRPDVTTLDLQMPGMSGLDVLRALRGRSGTRVIMVSTYMQEGTENAFQALEEGAVDFLDKTSVRNRMDFAQLGEELVRKIRQAAGAMQPPASPTADTGPSRSATIGAPWHDAPSSPVPAEPTVPRALVVIGASTGGPPAVRRFLDALPPMLPAAFVIAQHMPPGFTEGFARRLNGTAPVRVAEVESGRRLDSGTALVVPSGAEVDFRIDDDGWSVELLPARPGDQHRPSVDRTLMQAAAFAGERTIAVILTGMGHDGAEGARRVKALSGRVFTQSAASCVIDGMPKAARSAVSVDGEGDPEALAARVAEAVLAMPPIGGDAP